MNPAGGGPCPCAAPRPSAAHTGLGLVWRERPGVRDGLGWAVEGEQGFTTIMQRTTRFKYNAWYSHAMAKSGTSAPRAVTEQDRARGLHPHPLTAVPAHPNTEVLRASGALRPLPERGRRNAGVGTPALIRCARCRGPRTGVMAMWRAERLLCRSPHQPTAHALPVHLQDQ